MQQYIEKTRTTAELRVKQARKHMAFKVLSLVMFGSYRSLQVLGDGKFYVPSVRTLSRLFGMESKRMNAYLQWLFEHGYITQLEYSENRRSVKFHVRKPPNV